MRSDELYLRDIVEAADFIAEFLNGIEANVFHGSELLRSAVAQKLLIVGEAAARVSDATRMRNSQLPWARIVGFRNILVHAYFGIDWDVVWNAATVEAPVLRLQIVALLEALQRSEA